MKLVSLVLAVFLYSASAFSTTDLPLCSDVKNGSMDKTAAILIYHSYTLILEKEFKLIVAKAEASKEAYQKQLISEQEYKTILNQLNDDASKLTLISIFILNESHCISNITP